MRPLVSKYVMRDAAFALALALVAAPAAAATYSVNVVNPLDLGNVAAAASGDTVFRINPSSGLVTTTSGSGRRLATGPVRALVTITCRPARGGDTACDQDNVAIRVGVIGATSGRARALRNFTVAMETATLVTPVTGTNPLAFTVAPIGNASKTFHIGADFPVAGDDSGLPSGDGENGFYAYVVNAAEQMLAGDSDKGRVRAFRALSIDKSADLNFGRIALPLSGSGSVAIDPATGQRTVTGGVGFPTPAPSRATFMVAGEGGQAFSISTPSTFQLTGPSTLTVTTSTTATPSPTLSGALGAAGTYRLDVGGSFPISSTTPTGAYSGVLTISLDYN